METYKVAISSSIASIVAGKLEDRLNGDSPAPIETRDVYWKMIDGGAVPHHQGAVIEATIFDLIELNEEMKWALDGWRDLDPGEVRAARSLLSKTARMINSIKQAELLK